MRCAIVLMLLVCASPEGLSLWKGFSETVHIFIGSVDSMKVEDLNKALENIIARQDLDAVSRIEDL